MNNIEYTKSYGAPDEFTMNCWFCNQSFQPNLDCDRKDLKFKCDNHKCYQHYVTYFFNQHYSLNIMQFKANLNNFNYFINYYDKDKRMLIVKQTYCDKSVLFDYETILDIPYNRLTLTLDNYKDKLPILLLFS